MSIALLQRVRQWGLAKIAGVAILWFTGSMYPSTRYVKSKSTLLGVEWQLLKRCALTEFPRIGCTLSLVPVSSMKPRKLGQLKLLMQLRQLRPVKQLREFLPEVTPSAGLRKLRHKGFLQPVAAVVMDAPVGISEDEKARALHGFWICHQSRESQERIWGHERSWKELKKDCRVWVVSHFYFAGVGSALLNQLAFHVISLICQSFHFTRRATERDVNMVYSIFRCVAGRSQLCHYVGAFVPNHSTPRMTQAQIKKCMFFFQNATCLFAPRLWRHHWRDLLWGTFESLWRLKSRKGSIKRQ